MWDPTKLKVYEKSVDFHIRIKKLTLGFPKFEMYELGGQMRRASDSIGANIREGSRKRTSRDYISYLHNALGSADEMKHHIRTCFNSGYISEEDMEGYLLEVDEIMKMIYGVVKFVREKNIV